MNKIAAKSGKSYASISLKREMSELMESGEWSTEIEEDSTSFVLFGVEGAD